MKKDITTREDVELLVRTFYDKVKADPLISMIFSRVNWEKHLPVMFDFWENTLFYTGSYTGNPLEVHRRVNNFYPLNEAHFDRWAGLFTSTVDELFEGTKAVLAKQRAVSLAVVLKIKIVHGAGESPRK